MKAEILCVGTELLTGEILNTNVKYISEQLVELGIDVIYHTTVGDNKTRIVDALKTAYNRVDLVITSGGLGPTIDDVTKESAAEYFGVKLVLVDEYYELIKEAYKKRGNKKLPVGAIKEASILEGSMLLHNRFGLAPSCYYVEKRDEHICGLENEKKLIILPGPPFELQGIMDTEVVHFLRTLSNETLVMRKIEIINVPESKVNDDLIEYLTKSNPTVAPYAKGNGVVHVRVAMKGNIDDIDEMNDKLDIIIQDIISLYDNAYEIDV